MLGYRHSLSRSSGQLQSLANAREQEAASLNNAAVDAAGELLEYETLELRIHPPNVRASACVCSQCSQHLNGSRGHGSTPPADDARAVDAVCRLPLCR